MNEDTMGLGIKLVIYDDGYHTNVVKEITGFNSASEAAHYRDHSEYAGAPSELQLDYNNYLDFRTIPASDDMRDQATDDGRTREAPRLVIQYHDKACQRVGRRSILFVCLPGWFDIGWPAMKFKKLYVLMVLAVFTGCTSLGLVLFLGS